MVVEVLNHFFVATLGYADFVFRDKRKTTFFFQLLKLGSRNATHRALFWSVVTFVNITAYGANEFLFHNGRIFNMLCQ